MDSIAQKAKKRISWLDLARTIAILCVVLCHATESVNTLELETVPLWGFCQKVVVFSMFTIGRLGVPIFFFLSGYLLLDREYNANDCHRFWKRNLIPLFISAEIWIVLINLFLTWYHGNTLDFKLLILQMCFLRNLNMGHMWYLPVILGIYLFLPIIAIIIQKIDRNILLIPFVVSGIYLFGVPLGNLLLKALPSGVVLARPLDLDFVGGIYGIYLCIGYGFKEGYLRRFSTTNLFMGTILFFILAVGFQLFMYSKNVRYNIWYDSIFLLGGSICLFSLIRKAEHMKTYWLFQRISICSFGIYVIHRPIQYLLDRYFIPQEWHIGVMVLWLSSFVISWLLVEAISRIPHMGRILFLIKDK